VEWNTLCIHKKLNKSRKFAEVTSPATRHQSLYLKNKEKTAMYPSFYEFFKYTFGIELKFLMLFKTFGFFMVLSFIVGGYAIFRAMKRKEALGELTGVTERIKVGEAPSIPAVIFNSLFGFFFGYKAVHAFMNFSTFAQDPQLVLFNGDGNFIGGILGALLFGGLNYWEKKQEQLPEPVWKEATIMPSQRLTEMLTIAAITGVLGAKILASVEDWSSFVQDPIGSLLSFSGLTYYGGLITAAIAIFIYASRKKIHLRHLMDCAAPGLILGYAVGRMGCQFSGDGDWGIPNSSPKPDWMGFVPDWIWSYNYPHNVANSGVLIPDCEDIYCRVLEIPVYPTPIYEIFLCTLIFLILWSLRKSIKIPGTLFGIYLMLNGIERFLVESIRVNPRYEFLGFNPSQAQMIAVGLFLSGVLLSLFLKMRYGNKTEIPAPS